MASRLSPLDEQLSESQYAALEEEKLITESEALQEEIITRIPGFVTLLKQYELKPLVKIFGAILIMVIIYWFVGWDAVVSGIMLYLIIAGVTYLLQMKNQDKDITVFVEMKLAGQRIRKGDHSLYSKEFFTTESRFAVWHVPNTIIRRGLFKVPGDQPPTLMPGSGKVIFCDLFDRINRTCVLPEDMDVSNIAFATNANPLLIEKMERIGEQVKLDVRTERWVREYYNAGKMTAKDAMEALEPVKIRKRALLSPTNKTKRDIFFELQTVVPQMREKISFLSNKMFLLADFIAAKGIYQGLNRPMPEDVKSDHNFVYKITGLPKIKEGKRAVSKEEY